MKIKLTESQLKIVLKEMRFDGKKPIEFSDETVELEQDNLGEGRKKKRKIPKKYMTKNKSAMRKEINKYAGKDSYKTKWDADYKSGKGGVGKRYKTKKSASTKAYERMYGSKNESYMLEEGKSSTDKTLKNKSKASGIPKYILKQVHSRGMAAWNSGHRPGTPQNAWAMGRVNSFITGSGGARKADADLWKKAKKAKDKKKKSKKNKKNESVNINRMMVTENRTIVSEGLRYHLDNQIPLFENIYRYGSDNYFNLINEVKKLYSENKIDLSPKDIDLITEFNVEKGIYEGKEVWLNAPFEVVELNEAEYRGRKVSLNSPKKSGSENYVFVTGCLKDKNKVKKLKYGSAMRDKLKDPDRRNAYSARHGCEGLSLKDKCTKKYWACRKPKDFAGVNAWW